MQDKQLLATEKKIHADPEDGNEIGQQRVGHIEAAGARKATA